MKKNKSVHLVGLAENVKLTKVTLKEEKEALIYDNCMPDKQFLMLKSILMSENFPWYYNHDIVPFTSPIHPVYRAPIEGYDNDDVSQYVHGFFRQGDYAWSSYTEAIKSILDLINPKAWIRVKANLGCKATKHLVSGWHYDLANPVSQQPYNNSISAQLHINTNNGYTLLDTGDKVESVENRLLLHSNDILHTGINQTDTNIRVLLSFNFFHNHFE